MVYFKFLSIFIFLYVNLSWGQEVTTINKNSFVVNMGELKLEVGKEYTFLTSEDQLVRAKVSQIKDGKAVLKTSDMGSIKKGITLSVEENSHEAQDAKDGEATQQIPSDGSLIYKLKKHQFTMGLGFLSLDAISLKNASGSIVSTLDDVSLMGFNIGYQYHFIEYFSAGAMMKYYFGKRQITDNTDSSTAKVSSNFSYLNLFVAGHYNNFFLRLGYLPTYSFELTENEDSVELSGSGTEIALGYLHMFEQTPHGISIELFKTSGEFEEVTLKDGDTTVLTGKLYHKVNQDASGIAVNWAFKF